MPRAHSIKSPEVRSLRSALHLSLCWFSAVSVTVYLANGQGLLPMSLGSFSCGFLDSGPLQSSLQNTFKTSQAMRVEAGLAVLAFNFLLIWAFLYRCCKGLENVPANGSIADSPAVSLVESPSDEMKEQLLSNLGHEVRTPVAAVCSYLELIQRAPQSQLPALIRSARLSAQHLMDVTQNILDAAKLQAQKLSLNEEEISLRQLLVEVSSIVNTLVERKNLDFYIGIHPDTPDSVRADPLRIKQILLNLLSNAVKFTQEGHVALLIKAKIYDRSVVFLSFSVIDTGIGIQAEQLESLFKCFSQIDSQKTRSHGGAGLGLFISRQLAELMKGSVEYEPAQVGGSQFTLRVPVVMTSLGEFGHRPRYPDRVLLLASSRREELEYMQAGLRAEYAQMHCVSRGSDLLKHISSTNLPVDLLIGKCSPRLQNAISSVLTDGVRKVGLVSALGQGHEIARMLQLGVDRHVIRPGLPADILNAFDFQEEDSPPEVGLPLTPESQILRGKRILLAEDTEMLREACSAYLVSHGAEVDTVADGVDAVRFALNPARRYDLILMDIQMPNMDGNQATKLIREHLSNSVLPIYALTSHCSWSEIKLSLDAGMNGHLQKPLQIREVLKICGVTIQPVKPAGSRSSLPTAPALIDWSSGLSNFSGNTTVYSRTLATFRDQLDELLVRGRVMNWSASKEVAPYLHKCKGMALTAGAIRMATMAARLQRFLIAGRSLEAESEAYLSCMKDTRVHLNDLNAIRNAGAVNEAVDTRR